MLAANHKEEMDEWLVEIRKCMEEDQGTTSQRYSLTELLAGIQFPDLLLPTATFDSLRTLTSV